MAVTPHIYMAMIHTAEEGGYWGEIANLPGCLSQGETLEELEANLLEAIEALTEASAEYTSMTLTFLGAEPSGPVWQHVDSGSVDGVRTVSS